MDDKTHSETALAPGRAPTMELTASPPGTAPTRVSTAPSGLPSLVAEGAVVTV